MSEVKVNKISPRTNCGTVTVGDSGDSVTVTAGVPVTVNGDLKSNALKATDGGSIISQSGTTITLGASGDTINLASGASQSGFGREGSVDWDTTPKTATFSAVSGNGYFVNTTSGVITVNLPVGSAGSIVAVNDYASTAATNNITIIANGSEKIESSTTNRIINTNGVTVTLVYVDSTQGWKVVDSGEVSNLPQVALFTTATGGNSCGTNGNFKFHIFTSPGTFCVSQIGNSPTNPAGGPAVVDYLVLAGGAGGGNYQGGGGGAGGFRESHSTPVSGCYTASPLATATGITLPAAGPFAIAVGAGGAPGGNGSVSTFSTITSTGGGGGQNGVVAPGGPGANPGGSGGGGNNGSGSGGVFPGGSGNTPPVSPPQGQPGGAGTSSAAPSVRGNAGGGGGALSAGASGSPAPGGGGNGMAGGNGVATDISDGLITRAGGGGGGAFGCGPTGGAGGSGGGGAGGNSSPFGSGPFAGVAGTVNTGSGGGGAGRDGAGGSTTGAAGGSGIVVIRYKFQ